MLALETGTVDGILAAFVDVARVLGAEARGRALVAGLRARMAALAAATGPLPRPTVACLEWLDPLFTMGNWGPELVALAGGAPVFGAAGARSTTSPWDAVVAADPDVIVVAPCGFGIDRTLARDRDADRATRLARPARGARRTGRVADGNLYFNRSGPLLFDTPEILAEILHPREFPTRAPGTRWRLLS